MQGMWHPYDIWRSDVISLGAIFTVLNAILIFICVGFMFVEVAQICPANYDYMKHVIVKFLKAFATFFRS